MERAEGVELGILQRVARGDADAVGACMERYSPLVWSLARRLRCDPSDAEDAVQEIFIEVWRSAARYDPALASEGTFIATIARRRLIDRQRAKGRQPTTEEIFDEARSYEERTLERLGEREEAQRARALIERLRPDQRRVLGLAVFEGLSHSAIAELTGLPLGTVKSHVRRGMERVARAMRPDPTSAEEE